MAFKDLTEEQKQRRRESNKRSRERMREFAVKGGFVPQERVSRSPEEQAEIRAFHNERRRKTMQAIYRRLRDMGLSPAEADAELEDIAEQVAFFPNQGNV